MKKLTFPAILLSVFVLLLSFNACKQPTPTPPTPPPNVDSSWWTINTNEYATSYTFVNGSGSYTFLTGSDNNSSFTITFHLPYIPAQGNYLLDCGNTSSSAACMEISYNGIKYRAKPSQGVYLQADSANQRAKIKLPLTWFYNTILPDDSVAVNGVFLQP